jgi:CarD family transcriptional regulator
MGGALLGHSVRPASPACYSGKNGEVGGFWVSPHSGAGPSTREESSSSFLGRTGFPKLDDGFFKGVQMFKIGDLAVYPAHGVGVIEKVETQEISGCQQDFYVMRILDNDMIIMIPTTNVNNVGLREIIGQTEVPKLYSILKERNVTIDNQTWNRRYREYMDKIKTGSVYEVAEVYRDLLILKLEKDLSFGEKNMLDTAKSLLVKEISLARNVGEEQVERDLDRIFA